MAKLLNDDEVRELIDEVNNADDAVLCVATSKENTEFATCGDVRGNKEGIVACLYIAIELAADELGVSGENLINALAEEYVKPDREELDKCQECHNSLVCLSWARDGLSAKCDRADYFAEHYASGKEKLIGAELLDEEEQN